MGYLAILKVQYERTPNTDSMDMSSVLRSAWMFLSAQKRFVGRIWHNSTSDHQKQHVHQRHTKLIYRLKDVGTFDTETTEGDNYQIAFPQVTSRLNSRGKIGLS